MKLTCVGKKLKDAVTIAERNTIKNQTVPILGSIFFEAHDNNTVTIRSTNLETAVEISFPARVEKKGIVVVSAKNLSMFLAHINDETISLQDQNENISIKTPHTQTVVRGHKSEDFPLFPKTSNIKFFTFNGSEFAEALSSVVVACSTSDIKPELASVYVRIFKNTVTFAATDSFRLAEKTITSKNNFSDTLLSLLIPQRSVLEILKIIGEEPTVKIGFNKNQIIIQSPMITFISRLTDGVFPDYEQIIPKKFETTIVAKTEEFVRAVRAASVFAGRLNDISLTFDSSENTVSFFTSNTDVGEHTSNISVTISGEKLTAKYNWRYLFDGVSQARSEYISLGLDGDQTPLIIKEKAGSTFLYLVMPMRGV